MAQQPVAITQIHHFKLADGSSSTTKLEEYASFREILDICERYAGLVRVYWGRSLEHPQHAQLHIVRNTLDQHQRFLLSDEYRQVLRLLEELTKSKDRPTVRHARLQSWSPDEKSLARGAPFTGTAIYLNTNDAWDEGAWPLWTHVVRHIDGCLGGAGGPLLEPVETVPGPLGSSLDKSEERQTFQRCKIVYVGWETTEKHHDYHHTSHFAEHSVILRCGNEGFAEYGHIVFEGSREKTPSLQAKM